MPVKFHKNHKNVTHRNGIKQSCDWEAMRREYLDHNLNHPEAPVSLKELAVKYKVSYGLVRNHSHDERWAYQLADLLDQKENKVTTEVVKRSVVSEVEVRLRQAGISRLAVAKAVAKLRTIDPDDLTVKEAIDLLKLGLEQERKALGLPEMITVGIAAGDDGGQQAIAEARALIARLRDRDAPREYDVTPDPSDPE